MTQAELQELGALEHTLETTHPATKEWDEAYERYCDLRAKQQEEYKAENIGKLKEFYDEHIAGKEWAEIDQDAWDWYSDYHKDVFGYRPRTTAWTE